MPAPVPIVSNQCLRTVILGKSDDEWIREADLSRLKSTDSFLQFNDSVGGLAVGLSQP